MASVFVEGTFGYYCLPASSVDSSPPPKPLKIVTPTEPGTYPIILLLHGFYLHNSYYEGLLQHIVSHGFIAVAPQLYELLPPSGQDEINSASEVANWLSENLSSLLLSENKNIIADFTKVAISGHSRGGKIAFALALGHATEPALSFKFSVLIGIDPVDGLNKTALWLEPHILTYKPCSFDLDIPIAVIGTGLGSENSNNISLPCAPDGLNHKEFFNECQSPRAHFVAKDFGHMDMLDDDAGTVGQFLKCLCKKGCPKDHMRRATGGIIVAFLNAYLNDDSGDLLAIVANPSLSPATLEDVECH